MVKTSWFPLASLTCVVSEPEVLKKEDILCSPADDTLAYQLAACVFPGGTSPSRPTFPASAVIAPNNSVEPKLLVELSVLIIFDQKFSMVLVPNTWPGAYKVHASGNRP